MTTTVEIRPGLPEDAGAISSMLARLADHLGELATFSSNESIIRRYGFGKDARFHTQIAIDAAGSAGGLSLYFPHFSTTRGRPGVYVQDLWVDDSMRGLGAGERLLAATSHHAAKSWGAAYLALTVHKSNDAAAGFYNRLGFDAIEDEQPMTLAGAAFSALLASGEAAS